MTDSGPAEGAGRHAALLAEQRFTQHIPLQALRNTYHWRPGTPAWCCRLPDPSPKTPLTLPHIHSTTCPRPRAQPTPPNPKSEGPPSCGGPFLTGSHLPPPPAPPCRPPLLPHRSWRCAPLPPPASTMPSSASTRASSASTRASSAPTPAVYHSGSSTHYHTLPLQQQHTPAHTTTLAASSAVPSGSSPGGPRGVAASARRQLRPCRWV